MGGLLPRQELEGCTTEVFRTRTLPQIILRACSMIGTVVDSGGHGGAVRPVPLHILPIRGGVRGGGWGHPERAQHSAGWMPSTRSECIQFYHPRISPHPICAAFCRIFVISCYPVWLTL